MVQPRSNENRDKALEAPDSRSGEVHALIYIGDQIDRLIEAIAGFVKVGDVVTNVTRVTDSPPAKTPGRAATKKPAKSLDETHPVEIDDTDDNGEPLLKTT